MSSIHQNAYLSSSDIDMLADLLFRKRVRDELDNHPECQNTTARATIGALLRSVETQIAVTPTLPRPHNKSLGFRNAESTLERYAIKDPALSRRVPAIADTKQTPPCSGRG